ncbi:MAG: carboxypeptidase regulatory-like domain-containing protein [Acidobacteria bacterium]|nr:carboxypeptidase regulatory-like domain-containing protein [Acidobacteriota bacterium]
MFFREKKLIEFVSVFLIFLLSIACNRRIAIPAIHLPTDLSLVEIEEELLAKNMIGCVIDPTGARITGVKVELLDRIKKKLIAETVTNQKGRFFFGNVQNGKYCIRISLEGFNTIIYNVKKAPNTKKELVLLTVIIQ